MKEKINHSVLKTLCILFILSLFVASQAAPSITGGRGLFLLEDATSEDYGVIAVSSYLLFHKDAVNSYVGDVTAPHILYSPLNFIDLFYVSGKVITRSDFKSPEFWETKFYTKKHDRIVGGKISLPIPMLKLGVRLTYTWPRDTSENVSSIRETNGFRWIGLATLKLNERVSALPNILVNYSESDNIREYGAGLEISGSGGAIFVEAQSSEAKSNKMFSNILDNIILTPGLRINLGGYSSLSGGVMIDIMKREAIPDYVGIIGLTIGSALLKPPQPKIGILTGTITDANTGGSLIGTISFPEKPKLKPVQSDGHNGVFKVMKIPAGLQVVEVTCTGYQKIATAINIEANKVNAYDFKLRPLVTYGTIAGNVYDASNRKPLAAILKYNNKEIETDEATGAFKIDKIETGVLTIEANRDGYFNKVMTVAIEENKVNQVDFAMVSSVLRGYFIGQVINKINADPLKAVISFPKSNLSDISTDSLTGIFQAELPVGSYPIFVKSDGFVSQTGLITIEKEKTSETKFELMPTDIKTIFTGKISDKQTASPLQAVISFPEVGIAPITTDLSTGIYRAEIPLGSYLVEVKSSGYLTQNIMIVLEKDKVLEKNFELVKAGMTITLKGVYFELGKAILKPESYSALQDAGKILADNPDIRVEIQGHTDNTGSQALNQTLSEKRAYAVMGYLITNLGIAPQRLTAKGYGSSQPIASNTTAEGRALNRRVDFKILE